RERRGNKPLGAWASPLPLLVEEGRDATGSRTGWSDAARYLTRRDTPARFQSNTIFRSAAIRFHCASSDRMRVANASGEVGTVIMPSGSSSVRRSQLLGIPFARL